jgi:NAD(P)-dependent dehydrogenase (short-subunit alcohol dehydrogenase family)
VHVANQTTEEFDRIFRTNVYAGFWLSRAAVPYLPPGSNIIFTASLAGENPARRSTAYSASKAAILSFSQGLSGQLGTAGIRVNAVLPSLTYSPFLHTIGLTNVELDVLAPTSPIGRLEQPVEVAVQYVNFADPQNSYASGGFVGTPGSNY